MKALVDLDGALVFGIPTRGGEGVREGMLIEGPQGWGEFSPPPSCDDRDLGRWLTAAIEPGTVGWPDPVRGRVPVSVAVGPVDPVVAGALVGESGCRTAEVAVARSAGSLADDVARVEAVRDALGPDGSIRCHAAGAWDVDSAVTAIAALAKAAGELEYVEAPCRTAEELVAVRRRVDVRIAADVGVALSAEAADVAVLVCGPLGGVRRALRLAESSGLTCVVSSAMETSIGLAAGLALAGVLPELPFACGLGTRPLLGGDVVAESRSLIPVAGYLPVAPMPASPDQVLVQRFSLADSAKVAWWRERLRAAAGSAG
ncbi:MAG: o-succinylbenzoate synthase [Mycobacterium sp.]